MTEPAAQGRWDPAMAKQLEDRLGYTFRDAGLLERAFTHPSYSYETDGTRGNERLEYLGDAVLDLVVAHLLFDAHPEWSEGELTRGRKTLVNNRALAEQARRLELGSFVQLGRGERKAGGADRDRLLGNLFEALIGAIYLDGGLEAAEAFLRRTVGDQRDVDAMLERDAKTRLQEWSMAQEHVLPAYELVHDSGVENDETRFTAEVAIGPKTVGEGRGRTKREAEQRAAAAAIAGLGVEHG